MMYIMGRFVFLMTAGKHEQREDERSMYIALELRKATGIRTALSGIACFWTIFFQGRFSSSSKPIRVVKNGSVRNDLFRPYIR